MLFAQTRLYPASCETVGGLNNINSRSRRSEFAEFSAKQRRARSFCRFPPDCHVSNFVFLNPNHRQPTGCTDRHRFQDYGQQQANARSGRRRGAAAAAALASAALILAPARGGEIGAVTGCKSGYYGGTGGNPCASERTCRPNRRLCAGSWPNAALTVFVSRGPSNNNNADTATNKSSRNNGREKPPPVHHPLSAKIEAGGGDGGGGAFCHAGNGNGKRDTGGGNHSCSVSSSSSLLSIPHVDVAARPDDNRDDLQEEGAKVEKPWTAQEGAALYRVDGWGSPYFVVNSAGHVAVRPWGSEDGSDELDLYELLEALGKRNVALPMIIRFPDIVRHRMKQLQECFNSAIAGFGYQGHFQGVFPVKCNHERYLVEDIVRFGRPYRFGLEAGSKPEVLIAITMLRESEGALLVCNGYKDSVYIESVLLARQLGVNAIIVLEQMDELQLVIDISRRLGAKPVIGVRAKLSTKHNGHWGETSGDKGKFGLTVMEMVQVVYTLKQNYANDVVAALLDACVFKGVRQPIIMTESGRALGSHHSVLVFDVLSASEHTEAAVLKHLKVLSENASMGLGVCDENDDSHPAWMRHPKLRAGGISRNLARMDMDPGEYLLSTFYQVYKTMGQDNFQEAYNDAKQFKSEAGSLFKLGCLSLEQRAQAETLFKAVCHRVLAFSRDESEMPDDMEALRKAMSSVYHVNLSIFRSAPDSWAIDQIFPIMPVHRLTEEPTVQATLADLTCDSDGKINRFIGSNGEISHVLPVHELRKGEPYYMALFLGGVYQEVMGSLHNLFGATNVVHVMSRPKTGSAVVNGLAGNGKLDSKPTNHRGGYSIDRVVRGQTMVEVLRTVQHVGEDMMEELRCEAEDAVADGRLTIEEAQTLLLNYQRSLGSYTYLTR
ncbi:hypothetical protein CBR_g48280 [Chara braunii]|uniref:Arginine decarboxylase n=1 Tax=Chara braunii TaxID=69332 RepID=A0A388M2P0_CHABU|nr:hypothetical protein CBR_g48280 [Chara braunii]|eukprot:GBG88752.1 hypothetical protein CBR_g48280 [Chara braunii]